VDATLLTEQQRRTIPEFSDSLRRVHRLTAYSSQEEHNMSDKRDEQSKPKKRIPRNSERGNELKRLRQEQEEVAQKLYATNPKDKPEQHQQLQDEYNRIGRKRHEVAGAARPYIEKRDVRHELDPGEVRTVTVEGGSTQQSRTIRMPLYNPDTVINWRRHECGRAADTKVRSQSGKLEGAAGDGDHAGHHIACRFGADPACFENVARQNGRQNGRGGTYFEAEQQAAKLARENPDRKFFIEVEEVRYPEKRGEKRPISRNFNVVDEQGRTIGRDGRVMERRDPGMKSGRDCDNNVAAVQYGNFPERRTEKAKNAQEKSANWDGWHQGQSRDASPTKSPGELLPMQPGREIREQRSQRENESYSLAGAFGGKQSPKATPTATQIDDGLISRRQEITGQREKPNLTLVKNEHSASTPSKPRL
jgi:hypothetical protein